MRQVITLKCCHPLISNQTPTVTLQGCAKVKICLDPNPPQAELWLSFIMVQYSTVLFVSHKALQSLDKQKHCVNGLCEWVLETLINYWCNGRSHSWIHITHHGHTHAIHTVVVEANDNANGPNILQENDLKGEQIVLVYYGMYSTNPFSTEQKRCSGCEWDLMDLAGE